MEVDISNIDTRKHAMNLHLPIPDSEFHKTMLFYRGALEWNRLPAHIKDCYSIDGFKKLLKCHIRGMRVSDQHV